MKKETNNSINFLPGILFVGVFAVVMTGILFALNYVNQQKNATMVRTYTEETEDYISRNKEGINTIMTTIFDSALSCPISGEYEKTQACKRVISDAIAKNIDSDITDYSSIMFARYNSQKGELEVMRLSGDVSNRELSNEHAQELKELLEGNTDSISWNDYFYELKGSEVVVPVKSNGETIGAIVRGVIE